MEERSCKNCIYCRQKEKKEGVLYFCNECGMVAPEELLPTDCERWLGKDGRCKVD